jgi:hypothetical protein
MSFAIKTNFLRQSHENKRIHGSFLGNPTVSRPVFSKFETAVADIGNGG